MSELNISVVIMRENILISGEIYTTGKYFTLPPAVTAVTNITSVSTFVKQYRNYRVIIVACLRLRQLRIGESARSTIYAIFTSRRITETLKMILIGPLLFK